MRRAFASTAADTTSNARKTAAGSRRLRGSRERMALWTTYSIRFRARRAMAKETLQIARRGETGSRRFEQRRSQRIVREEQRPGFHEGRVVRT